MIRATVIKQARRPIGYVQPTKRAVSRTRSVPAPTGGWNVRDSLADMDEKDAVVMDNWFPTTGSVEIRNGCDNWVTGITGWVETLMQYASAGTRKLFAAANSAFYDVSGNGAVGAAVDTGHTNNRYQFANFGTSGGAFLIVVNGADSPRQYNGTTWATNSITGSGLTDSNLIHVNVFKQRLFFVEKNTLKFWYLPVSTISGAASAFDLASFCQLGGELQAMATWTLDGGAGQDDHAVFITTNGEVLVYQGTDPGSAAAWSLVGVFRIGRPVGRRCFVKLGGDLVIITDNGYVPLSRALIAGGVGKNAISDKISGAVNEAVISHRSKFGWQAVQYPKGNMLLFNVPTSENDAAEQHVMNLLTGAWCRFTGWNAACFEVFDGNLYFGTSTKVVKADVGSLDYSGAIATDIEPAFNSFGNNAVQKHFKMVRPVFVTDGVISPSIIINVDYDSQVPTNVATSTGNASQTWSEITWENWVWSGAAMVQKSWQGVAGIGYSATVRMKITASNLDVALLSIDYMYEPGGVF